jgi:hypothetical protein
MLIFGNRDFKEFEFGLPPQPRQTARITLQLEECGAARKSPSNIRGHGFCQMFRLEPAQEKQLIP